MKSRKYKEKFGCLSAAKRVWAISSINGEAGALIALHDEISQRWEHGDRLVYLGNYLGRGGAIKEVLDELLAFRINRLCLPGMIPEDIVFLRGAQEEIWRSLLQIQLAPQPASVLDWMIANDIGATLKAYGDSAEEAKKYIREGILATTKWTNRLREKVRSHPGHSEIFVALRRAAYTQGGELLFVHAGLDPNLPVIEQNDSFWWGNRHFKEISSPYCGFRKVIRGYEKLHRGVTVGPYTATIDGGCGFDGSLEAVCFTLDGEIADQVSIDP
ncbi:hypothetical protein GQF03_13160 [Sneathiella chungangensis]|uniref:Serine/threonine protein phosphatase n=1 Tax=Sneathiella chungangensis TaxID=1418234 RepID=A0A845MIN5_9PROT|nr:hypothetical protein [Sneathiella chungangensis]MZR23280.1 hypothetical protein [Sneathiella chungangensis]